LVVRNGKIVSDFNPYRHRGTYCGRGLHHCSLRERNAVPAIIRRETNLFGVHMKKIIIATALVTMLSGAAFAQSGANPSAPQPSSDGRGVNMPGTTSTGTAVDRPDSNMGSMKKTKTMKKMKKSTKKM
jgi:hypothetical protein